MSLEQRQDKGWLSGRGRVGSVCCDAPQLHKIAYGKLCTTISGAASMSMPMPMASAKPLLMRCERFSSLFLLRLWHASFEDIWVARHVLKAWFMRTNLDFTARSSLFPSGRNSIASPARQAKLLSVCVCVRAILSAGLRRCHWRSCQCRMERII